MGFRISRSSLNFKQSHVLLRASHNFFFRVSAVHGADEQGELEAGSVETTRRRVLQPGARRRDAAAGGGGARPRLHLRRRERLPGHLRRRARCESNSSEEQTKVSKGTALFGTNLHVPKFRLSSQEWTLNLAEGGLAFRRCVALRSAFFSARSGSVDRTRANCSHTVCVWSLLVKLAQFNHGGGTTQLY